jgi:chemotaxis protein methyltransferase CheR
VSGRDDASAWQGDLARLVEERIGVRLRVGEPWSTLEPFVEARCDALGLEAPGHYVRFLRDTPSGGEEFARLTAVCTNGQTSFMRDREQLDGIVAVARGLLRVALRPLQIWSAGCSTGEEPYSLSILLEQARVPHAIVATDVNAAVLTHARDAVYNLWSLRHVEAPLREACFDSASGGAFRLHDRVREAVAFQQHNLVRDELPRPQASAAPRWDIIVCRNVFIYYAAETMEAILLRMQAVLAPDGYLFLGASESLHSLRVALAPVAVDVGRVAFRHAALSDTAPPQASTPKRPTPTPKPTPLPSDAPLPAPLLTGASASLTVDFDTAVAALERGDAPAATALLETLMTEAPTHVLGRLTLGHLRLQSHDFERALDAYDKAQGDAPLWPEVHYFQGVTYRKLGNLEASEATLRRALFLCPQFWPASFLLAGIYERQARQALCARELQHTLTQLREGTLPTPFRSPVRFAPALALDATAVAESCAARLQTR